MAFARLLKHVVPRLELLGFEGVYDVRKIEAVLDLLIAEWTAIAVNRWDPADVKLRDVL